MSLKRKRSIARKTANRKQEKRGNWVEKGKKPPDRRWCFGPVLPFSFSIKLGNLIAFDVKTRQLLNIEQMPWSMKKFEICGGNKRSSGNLCSICGW